MNRRIDEGNGERRRSGRLRKKSEIGSIIQSELSFNSSLYVPQSAGIRDDACWKCSTMPHKTNHSF
jgi:hypothetical protein